MKKLAGYLLFLLLFPLLSHAEDVKPSAVLDTYRTWVKPGHTAAVNKALLAHIKQYHSGDWRWRVYDVLTGTTFRETYDAIHGAGSYAKRMEDQSRMVDHVVGEMIALRPEFLVK